MAMGRRKTDRQDPLFVTAESLPRSLGHPFYKALNRLLEEAVLQHFLPRFRWKGAPGDQPIVPIGTHAHHSIGCAFVLQQRDAQRHGVLGRCERRRCRGASGRLSR